MAQMVLKDGLVDFGDGEFEVADVVVDAGVLRLLAASKPRPSGPRWLTAAAWRSCLGCQLSLPFQRNWFRGRWDNLPLEPWMLFSTQTLQGPPRAPVRSTFEL